MNNPINSLFDQLTVQILKEIHEKRDRDLLSSLMEYETELDLLRWLLKEVTKLGVHYDNKIKELTKEPSIPNLVKSQERYKSDMWPPSTVQSYRNSTIRTNRGIVGIRSRLLIQEIKEGFHSIQQAYQTEVLLIRSYVLLGQEGEL